MSTDRSYNEVGVMPVERFNSVMEELEKNKDWNYIQEAMSVFRCNFYLAEAFYLNVKRKAKSMKHPFKKVYTQYLIQVQHKYLMRHKISTFNMGMLK